MKVELSQHPSGLVLCRIGEALSDRELAGMVQGVSKFLANGKVRILIEVSQKAGTATLEAVQHALSAQRDLAVKLGGEIGYVLAGSGPTLDEAVAVLTGSAQASRGGVFSALKQAKEEVERLRVENQMLHDRLAEIARQFSKPAGSSELVDALAHYRKLAERDEGQVDAKEPAKAT